MEFYVYEVDDYAGQMHFVSADYEHDCFVPMDDCYDDDRGEWDEEALRETAEEAVKARFGTSAVIIWE